MIITITSIKLKSLWHFFRLSYFGFTIVGQTKSQKGFIKLKNTGSGYLHYTMSCWQQEEDVKLFARSGAHLHAMRQAAKISTEVRIYTFAGEKMPDWKDAKTLVMEKGKVFTYS
jgi:hypothetical protein